MKQMRAIGSLFDRIGGFFIQGVRGQGCLFGKRSFFAVPILLFALVHGFWYSQGIRFDVAPLRDFFHFIDPLLYRTRLLESLFYLHCQPPLFNLFVGIVLQLFSDTAAPYVFQGLFLAMGLGIYLGLLAIQKRIGVRPGVALAVATVVLVFPSFVLYEHWLFYTFPLTFLLVLSAIALDRFLVKRTSLNAGLFFSVLALLCGIRSLFHLVYLLAAVTALGFALKNHRKEILRGAMLPVLFVFLLYFKNYVLFDHFTTSTWFGLNLWKTTGFQLSPDRRQDLVAQGHLSSCALIHPFRPLRRYPPEYHKPTGYEGIPVLSDPVKSTGMPNFNHVAYIAICDSYLRDSLFVLAHHPEVYGRGLKRSWSIYFTSSADYVFVGWNRKKIERITDILDTLFCGRAPGVRVDTGRGQQRPLYLFLLFGHPSIWLISLILSLRLKNEHSENTRLIVLYLCFTILFVALVGNGLNAGENNRFRFTTVPLMVILCGWLLERFVQAVKVGGWFSQGSSRRSV